MSTDRAARLPLQGMTLLLMAVATLVCELAIANADASLFQTLGTTVAWVCVMLVAWAALSRWKPKAASLPVLGTVTFLCLQFLPFSWEMASALVSGQSQPLEVVLVASFRNVGLGLAAFCVWPICLWLAGVASLFLVLFAASLAPDATILSLVGVYGVAASLWLMMGHWSGMGRSAGSKRESRTPIAAALAVSSLLVITVVVAEVGPERTASVLAELLPSSGGTTHSLPDARDGVNDGDAEVSAKDHAESTGFVDSDLFLDSPDPSLYDVFNELYGEPVKPRDQDRAIAISSNNVLEMENRPVDNHRASRNFALKRNRPRRSNRPTERAADALLYVRGETPLHLRLAAYDHFDGLAWSEETPPAPSSALTMDWGNWLRLPEPASPIWAGKLRHQIKIGLVETERLPLPPQVYRVRVGAVNRADFFSWAQNDILRMAAQRIPPGTMIETDLRTVRPDKLREVFIPAMAAYADTKYLHHREQADIAPEIRELAKTWASSQPRGWDQIRTIVERLRQDYVIDADAVDDGDTEGDATTRFLFETRRGPDYQFASAAALLLRSLRYPARLVSGLYVHPEKYDQATDHTPVSKEDVHFWTEVMLPDRTWIAIEPTPGYRLLGPAPTLTETLWAMVLSAWNWVGRNWPALLFAAAVALCQWRIRFELLDRWTTLTWRVRLAMAQRRGRISDRRTAILASLAFLEKRSRWSGAPRPIGQTPNRWHRPWIEAADEPARSSFARLSQLADWAAFSPAPPARGDADAFDECRLAVACWTLRRFQVAIAQRRAPPATRDLSPSGESRARLLTMLWHPSSVQPEGSTA